MTLPTPYRSIQSTSMTLNFGRELVDVWVKLMRRREGAQKISLGVFTGNGTRDQRRRSYFRARMHLPSGSWERFAVSAWTTS